MTQSIGGRAVQAGFALTAILTALVTLGAFSVDLYLPSMPAIGRELNASVAQVQLTLSAFLLGIGFAQLIYGPICDRFGRRRITLIGLIVYVIASFGCVFASSIDWLIFGRLMQAVGACAGMVAARAVVRDVYPREQAAKVFAYMGMTLSLAPILAPVVGGYLEVGFGWRAAFVMMLVAGVLFWLGATRMLPETLAAPNYGALRPPKIIYNYLSLLGNRWFVSHVMAGAFLFGALFSFIANSPLVLIDVIGLQPQHFGFAFMSCAVFMTAGSLLVGKLGHRIGQNRLIVLGIGTGIVGGVSLAVIAWTGEPGLFAVLAPSMGLFFGLGIVMPNTSAMAMAPFGQIAGTASALLGFLQTTTGALAGFLVGYFYDGDVRSMATIMAASAILSGISAIIALRSKEG